MNPAVQRENGYAYFWPITKHPFQVNECGERRGRPFFRVFWALGLWEEVGAGRSGDFGSQQHPQGRGSSDVCCWWDDHWSLIRTNKPKLNNNKTKTLIASRTCIKWRLLLVRWGSRGVHFWWDIQDKQKIKKIFCKLRSLKALTSFFTPFGRSGRVTPTGN